MSLGLKLWSINTDFYLEEAKRLYSEGCFDFIELYVVPNTLETIPKWKQLNIPFALHAPHFMSGMCLSDCSKENYNLEVFKEVEKFSNELKARYIVVHPGIEGFIEETIRQLKKIISIFPEFKELLLIENKPYLAPLADNKICRGATLEEIKQVLDSTNLGFCLDVGHAICSANSLKQEQYEYLERFNKLNPKSYHISGNYIDNEIDSHLHLNEGNYDLNKIFDIIDLNKNIVIETNKNSKTDLEDFTCDVTYLKGLIKCMK